MRKMIKSVLDVTSGFGWTFLFFACGNYKQGLGLTVVCLFWATMHYRNQLKEYGVNLYQTIGTITAIGYMGMVMIYEPDKVNYLYGFAAVIWFIAVMIVLSQTNSEPLPIETPVEVGGSINTTFDQTYTRPSSSSNYSSPPVTPVNYPSGSPNDSYSSWSPPVVDTKAAQDAANRARVSYLRSKVSSSEFNGHGQSDLFGPGHQRDKDELEDLERKGFRGY